MKIESKVIKMVENIMIGFKENLFANLFLLMKISIENINPKIINANRTVLVCNIQIKHSTIIITIKVKIFHLFETIHRWI